jgi:secreted trypsin-like serine protease
MKTSLAGVLALLLLIANPAPSQAIEGGTDATGNAYVVPIYNEDYGSSCSGALIASKVIVTAAHCVMDKNGSLAKKVWVGSPGDSMDSAATRQNPVEKIELSPTYSSSLNGNTVDNDIAFLIPKDSFFQKSYVELASSAENATLRSSQVPLRLFGYGYTDNSTISRTKFPYAISGSYSTMVSSRYPNSGFAKSTVGRVCTGDSGGPVFHVTASRTVLVGVISSLVPDINCAKKESDGSYLAMFTEISRFANLAFAASSYAASSTQTTVKSEYAEYEETISGLNSAIYESQNEYTDELNKNTKLKACLVVAKKIIKTKKGKLPKDC